jgi:hypothetical protein
MRHFIRRKRREGNIAAHLMVAPECFHFVPELLGERAWIHTLRSIAPEIRYDPIWGDAARECKRPWLIRRAPASNPDREQSR